MSSPPESPKLSDQMKDMKPFGVTWNDLELARKVAMEAWEKYGGDDGPTCDRIRANGIWNDHIAVQAAIAAIKELRRIEQTPYRDIRDESDGIPGESV